MPSFRTQNAHRYMLANFSPAKKIWLIHWYIIISSWAKARKKQIVSREHCLFEPQLLSVAHCRKNKEWRSTAAVHQCCFSLEATACTIMEWHWHMEWVKAHQIMTVHCTQIVQSCQHLHSAWSGLMHCVTNCCHMFLCNLMFSCHYSWVTTLFLTSQLCMVGYTPTFSVLNHSQKYPYSLHFIYIYIIWLSAKICTCKGLCTSVENKTLVKTVLKIKHW